MNLKDLLYPARKPGETMEQYRARRKLANTITKLLTPQQDAAIEYMSWQ